MFIITTPKELKAKITSSMIVDKLCEKLMEEIVEVNNRGGHKCTFYVCGVYVYFGFCIHIFYHGVFSLGNDNFCAFLFLHHPFFHPSP